MTKFNVGDTIRISGRGAGGLAIGTLAKVVRVERDGDVWLESGEFYLKRNVELAPSTNDRLAEAEANIAALQSKVAALETVLAEKSKLTYSIEGETFATKKITPVHPRLRTPNQRRADVIKRAQAFVADLEKRTAVDERNTDGNGLFNGKTTKLSLHVNAEKGVVTALAHSYYGGKLFAKAFAKCAPGDVFNADIGKAIAAGYLYGVKVPKEFTDAVKPTEVVVGMRVKYIGSVRARYGDTSTVYPPGDYVIRGGRSAIDSQFVRESEIIDDSNAVYE